MNLHSIHSLFMVLSQCINLTTGMMRDVFGALDYTAQHGHKSAGYVGVCLCLSNNVVGYSRVSYSSRLWS